MEILNNLLSSPIPEVRDLASSVVKLKTKLDAKQITQDEFEELVKDLMTLEHIREDMVSHEAWRELKAAAAVFQEVKYWSSII